MSLYIGNQPVSAAYIGNWQIVAAYIGNRQVYGTSVVPIDSIVAPGFWSWWVYPQAESVGGFTRFGAAANNADLTVFEVDETELTNTSFVVSAGVYTMDDHNGPPLLTLSNGYLLSVYTGHNQDYTMRWRRSATGNIADLGAEQTRVMANPGRITTYSQIMESPTTPGTVFCFMRIATNNWYVMISTDYGATFGAERPVISTENQYYGLFRPLPGRDLIRAFVYPHPNVVNNVLRCFDIDLSSLNNGLLIANGVGKGYLSGSSYNGTVLPIVEANIPALYTPTGSNSIRLLDTHERGDAVLIVEFNNADGSIGTYKLGRLTGTNPHDAASWTWQTLISAGIPFYGTSNYFAGGEFAREPHSGLMFYLSRHVGSGYIHEQWSSIDAVTWTIRLVQSTATEKLLRPVTPLNASPRLPVLIGQGEWTHFTDYSMNIRGFTAAARATSLADLRWSIRALLDVAEGGTFKFLISWFGAPIPAGTTCTIDIAESGTAVAADFSATLDASIAAALTTGVTYDAANNRLSVTSAATSPLIVSRAVATGDATDDLETHILTLSNPSHGSIQIASATTTVVDPLGAPLNALSVGASAAWGMDPLTSLYSGPLIRLRRGSDDVESDFGCATGTRLLDTAAIVTWLNGATGYGAKWYDQTLNGFDAVQATTSKQLVYTAAATPNSRPVWRGDGLTKCFVAPAGVAINNITSGGGYFAIGLRANSSGGSNLGRAINKDTTAAGTGFLLRWFDATTLRLTRQYTNGSRNWHSTVPSNGGSAWAVYGCSFNSDLHTNLPVTRVNSATSGANSGAAPVSDTVVSDAPGDLMIGSNVAGDRGWNGDIFALAWFQDAPGTTDEEKVEDGIMAQYGVT